MLNRSVVIVRPKQPYLDWAAGYETRFVPDVKGEQTVYLIPVFESDEEAWEILGQACEVIFENELWAWHTDPSAWPKDRGFEMFREWFHVEFHSIVEDLCPYELIDEDEKEYR